MSFRAEAGRKTSDAKRSSPDSQEVRSILEHAPDVVDDDHDGDDEDEEDVDDEDIEEDQHRPDTPVAHTLAAEGSHRYTLSVLLSLHHRCLSCR